MSGKGYPPGATTVARTRILSECLNGAHEFKQAKKRHRPAPMPLMWTHILSYKPQETLVVSYNTVKTHVSHVYAKLGVHSQQELIDIVESGA